MTSNHRLRLELIVASVLLAFGLFALPGLIYWVGTLMLGAYAENAGPGTFYADFFGDLASGVVRAWALATGPLIVISLLRVLFLKRDADRPEEEAPEPVAATPQRSPKLDQRRVEPRVSMD